MADRLRRIYIRPFRIDVTVREGVPRLVPLSRLAQAIRAASTAAGAPTPATVGLILSDDVELARLNRRHLGERGPTDVLSFPLLPPEAFRREVDAPVAASPREGSGIEFRLPPGARVSLGDVVVSVGRAIAQARAGRGGQDGETAWDARDELVLLVVHGTLHLCGWDHADPAEGEAMRTLERQLLPLKPP